MPQDFDPRIQNRDQRQPPVNRNRQRRPQQGQRPPQQRRYRPAPPPEPEQTADSSTTIKGLIAVFMTMLIVVIIVMLFAKSLFVSSEELAKNLKTGHLTETEYVAIEAKEDLGEEVVTTEKKEKKKKSTTTEKEDDSSQPVELPEGLDTSVAGKYMVNDAVYLHPTPDSASANLATLPYGTELEVFGQANYGWYYVEYEGQYGYAWGTYFTKQG